MCVSNQQQQDIQYMSWSDDWYSVWRGPLPRRLILSLSLRWNKVTTSAIAAFITLLRQLFPLVKARLSFVLSSIYLMVDLAASLSRHRHPTQVSCIYNSARAIKTRFDKTEWEVGNTQKRIDLHCCPCWLAKATLAVLKECFFFHHSLV